MTFKKIMAILLLSLSMCVAFTACSKTEGKSARESSSDEQEDEEEEDEEDEEEETSSKKKKNKKKKNDDEDDKSDKKGKDSSDIVYESEPVLTESEYDGNYTLSYKLILHDDETADYYETTAYENSDYDYSTHYFGEYSLEDDLVQLFVRYNDSTESMKIYLEGDKISSVEYVYDAGVDELVGNTYTCTDNGMGICSFEVNEDGSATLHTEELEYTGYMSKYNDEWNLMVSNEETEENIDWIVYIDGNEFNYVPYAEFLYGDYAGELQAFGQYGDVTFTLNPDGTISTDMKIDGRKKHFEGNYYVNSEDGVISSAYLTCEDDATILDISFDEVDGMMNYHGHYMIPLAAG